MNRHSIGHPKFSTHASCSLLKNVHYFSMYHLVGTFVGALLLLIDNDPTLAFVPID